MVDRKVCITVNDRAQIKEQQIIQWQMNVEIAEKKSTAVNHEKKKNEPALERGECYERT